MANKKNIRRRTVSAPPSPLEQARDEMFQHIMRCGVVGAAPEHQGEWFDETMAYLSERYHELSSADVAELRAMGERFVKPPKAAEPQDGATSEAAADNATASAA
jgi:hypothetical protein